MKSKGTEIERLKEKYIKKMPSYKVGYELGKQETLNKVKEGLKEQYCLGIINNKQLNKIYKNLKKLNQEKEK